MNGQWIQSIDWLIDMSNDWLIEWLIDWLIDWLIKCLIDWFIEWLIDWLTTYRQTFRGQIQNADIQIKVPCQGWDEGRFSRSRGSIQQITTPIRNTKLRVPLGAVPEVLHIFEKKIDDSILQDDGFQRALPFAAAVLMPVSAHPGVNDGFALIPDQLVLFDLRKELPKNGIAAAGGGEFDVLGRRKDFLVNLKLPSMKPARKRKKINH